MVMVMVIVGAVLVLGVAIVAVGGVVQRLGPEPQRQVFDHREALDFVVEALPGDVTAELSYEDVQRILRLHLDFLHRRGISRSGGDLPDRDDPVVVGLEDGVAYVLARGELVQFRPQRDHVAEVITAQLAYFEAIGALSEVEGPEEIAPPNGKPTNAT